MPERTDSQPDRTRIPSGNWALPSAICASAALASIFLPWLSVAAVVALAWAVLAFRRERAGLVGALHRRDGDVDTLRDERRRDALFRAVLESSGVPIISTDLNGVITAASREATRTLGGGRELTGRRHDEIFTDPELHAMERHARAGESGRARIMLPIEGEMRTLIVSAEPIILESGQARSRAGSVVTVRDVTELVRAGDLKADFAANASHELRTPIASIRGAAETLRGPARHDDAMLERLTAMVAVNAARLEAMVTDLLDLSKLESSDEPPRLRDLDLRELCASLTETFEPVCSRRSLRIETEIDEACKSIRSDEGLLGLMVRNLVENSTKFAREDTEVRIKCEAVRLPPDPGSPPPPDADLPLGMRLTVRDKGLGIPLAHQQRIFERFYQVDRARAGGVSARGTGLGLAIVKHAALRLGGRVGVESVYQQGTTMTVELPGCVDADRAVPADPAPEPGTEAIEHQSED